MSQNNDMNLSLSGEAFAALRSDFNEVLHSTMRGMIDTEQDVAEINMKVKIILTESSAPDFTVAGGHQTREITKPKFEHSITAVIQRKEKKTGSFAGEYELVFDADTGTYVVRPIENGQTTLFDGDGPAVSNGEVIDADYTVVPDGDVVPALGEGPRALPGAAEEAEEQGDGDVPADQDDGALGDADEFEEQEIDPAHDPSKPFGWLRQFIGEAMHVTEAMGNFTVRTDGNKVVLSSATSPDNPFYCPKEKLEPHVGHTIACVGYGNDEIVNISIECEDCNEVLFDIDAPGYAWARQEQGGEGELDEGAEAAGGTDGDDAEKDGADPGEGEEPGGYGYEAPEE